MNTHTVVERTDCYFNEDLYEKFQGDLDPKLKSVLEYMQRNFEDVAELREEAVSHFNDTPAEEQSLEPSTTAAEEEEPGEPEGIYQRIRSRTKEANAVTSDTPHPNEAPTNIFFNDGFDSWVEAVANAVNTTMNLQPLPPSPSTLKEAFAGPDADRWRNAIYAELKNLGETGTFEEAEPTGRGMKMKWVLKASLQRHQY